VLGGTQPDRLVDLLAGPDDGLTSRFLWFWPDPVPPYRPKRLADNRAAGAALRRLSQLPLVPGEQGAMQPLVCRLADPAADVFQAWRLKHAADQPGGLLAGAYGKAPGQLLRLALVLEHLWWCGSATALPPTLISVPAIQAAAGLIEDYFLPMAARVFGDAALPDGDRHAATLARWIVANRPQKVNARDIRRKAGLPGLKQSENVALAISTLVEADWLRPAFERAGDTSGRQRQDYEVNPRLWEAPRG
jgi:hypothetical protein